QKVPTRTCPRLNALPVLNAEIRLIATTVPGSAQAIITATSSRARPTNRRRRTAYATSTPISTQPATASRLIRTELRIGRNALGSEKIVTKLSSVYVGGSTWVVQDRFSEKATSAMVATGASRTIVASTEAIGASQR